MKTQKCQKFYGGIPLICPVCRREKSILVADRNHSRFVCNICKSAYPIEKRSGVPRIISRLDARRHQVMESFGDKWSRAPHYGYQGATAAFAKRWFFERYNWYKSESNYRRFLQDKNNILDAGCGLGYLVGWIKSLFKDPRNIVGFDISDSIFEAAKKNQNGICFVQADIMNPPFKKNYFDYVISDGVLHHTPSTKKALESLLRLIKQGGVIEFYIYRKKNPIREFCDDYIRKYTTRMSANECWEFCKSLTELARQISILKSKVKIRRTIPILEIEKGVYTFHELLYYFFVKMFWNEKFSFTENNLVNFDWYHPQYAHRHSPDEIYSWAGEFNAKVEKINVIKSGIAVRMRKE